jgi:integrase
MPFDTLCYNRRMASHFPRKDSPYYWIRYQKADLTWGSKSSGVRRDSEGGLRKIEQRVAEITAKESVLKNEGGGAMFRVWVPSWLDYQYKNAGTKKRYQNAWAQLKIFLDDAGVLHPGEVTYALCHKYMRWRQNPEVAKKNRARVAAWNTALLELRVLGAVMQEAVRREIISVNPCAKLGIPRINQSEKREITREEEESIMAQLEEKPISKWMAEAFLVGMRQGCRLSEVKVPMGNVNEEAGLITFRAKGGKIHTAPLHEDLSDLVARARAEKREHLVELPPNASVRFGTFFRRKGYVGLCFHCTRVTVVTRLCRAGFSESQTMAYVGHSTALVHAIYAKLKAPDVAHLGKALG